MRTITQAAAGLALLAAGLVAPSLASAMPVAPLHAPTAEVETVRWVCGPYRCFWRPNYYGYYGGPAFYGPRPFYGPGFGWRRPGWGWRRW